MDKSPALQELWERHYLLLVGHTGVEDDILPSRSSKTDWQTVLEAIKLAMDKPMDIECHCTKINMAMDMKAILSMWRSNAYNVIGHGGFDVAFTTANKPSANKGVNSTAGFQNAIDAVYDFMIQNIPQRVTLDVPNMTMAIREGSCKVN